MKTLLLILFATAGFGVCPAQNVNVTKSLIGEWRVCKSTAAPLVFTFINKSKGEKGLLKNWNDPSDFVYKTSFTYTLIVAPKDSLTGNADIDKNLFLMTIQSKTLSGRLSIQSFLVHIINKDSIGFILTPGFITPLCRVEE